MYIIELNQGQCNNRYHFNEPSILLPTTFGKSVEVHNNDKITNVEILKGLIWCVENNIKLDIDSWKRYKESL